MFKTHLMISFLIGLLTFKFFSINKFVFITIVVLAGIIPDIDIPTSKIGRKTWPISKLLNLIYGHRGLIHSIFIPLLVLWVFFYFDWTEYGLAIFIGYIGHLIGDALSWEGIKFLHPVSRFRLRGFIKVGGFLEYILFIMLLAISFVNILKLF